MGQTLSHRGTRSSKRRRLKRGPIASVVWDSRDLTVIRLYVGFTAKEALRIFLSELRNQFPPNHDDSVDEISKAIDRYKIEQLSGANVIIRRRMEDEVNV